MLKLNIEYFIGIFYSSSQKSLIDVGKYVNLKNGFPLLNSRFWYKVVR